MLTLYFLAIASFLSLTQASVGPLFGPETPLTVFKGQITENGRQVNALLSVEVLYKANGNLVPLSLVQVKSLPDYEVHLSGLLFHDQNITNTAILRAQALDINGGLKQVKLELKDGKTLYQQDIELNSNNDGKQVEDDNESAYEQQLLLALKNLRQRRQERQKRIGGGVTQSQVNQSESQQENSSPSPVQEQKINFPSLLKGSQILTDHEGKDDE